MGKGFGEPCINMASAYVNLSVEGANLKEIRVAMQCVVLSVFIVQVYNSLFILITLVIIHLPVEKHL